MLHRSVEFRCHEYFDTDDNETNLKLLRAILEAEGHDVCCALDGVEALELLERQKLDAIISDILMPRMDGYRLCFEIRQREEFRTLPFIVYTSTYTSPTDEKTALRLGADKFLRKPAAPHEILKALQQAVTEAPKKTRKRAAEVYETARLKEYSQALVSKLEKRNDELQNGSFLLSTARRKNRPTRCFLIVSSRS